MAVVLINPDNTLHLNQNEDGLKDEESNFFPLQNGIYKFVNIANYSGSFGFQWKKYRKTQLDKFSGSTQSKDRFFAVTGWDRTDLTGENILEVGCGAGRFTQIVLEHTNANIYSIDYSDAVEANYENNGPNQRLKIFQASIYELPFEKHSFDKVFCFGVLQHTPDVKKSVKCLVDMVKPGEELIVDFYPLKGWWTKVHTKYIFRPFTKNMDHEKLLKLITKNISWMIVLSKFFRKLKIDRLTNRFIPICDIFNTLSKNLSRSELKEWAILDTFDMFSPAYDQPRKISTVKEWFEEFGMEKIWGGYIEYGNNQQVAVVKGIKK